MATSVEISSRWGNTIERRFAVFDNGGDAFDLSGATVWFTVKRQSDNSGDDELALLKYYWVDGDTSDGLTVTTPALGIVDVHIEPEDARTLDSGTTYKFDLKVKDANDDEWTPVVGLLSILAVTTRRQVAP